MEVLPLNRLFGRGAIYDPDDLNLVDRALRRLDLMPTPKRGMTTNTAEDVIGGVERLQREAGDLAVDGVMRPSGPTARRLADMMRTRLDDPALAATVSNPFGRADGNPWPFLVKTASAPAHVPVNRRPVAIPPLIRPAPKPCAAPSRGVKPIVIGRAVIPPSGVAGGSGKVPPWTPPSPNRKPDVSKPDASKSPPDGKPEVPRPNPGPNSEFADAIAKRESGGEPNRGWGAVNETKGPDGRVTDRALGRYQMTTSALVDAGYKHPDGTWTGKGGVKSDKDFLSSPDAQNAALGDFTGKLWGQLGDARGKIGGKINGIKGDITITQGGLIAAAHRRGASRVNEYFNWLSKNGGNSKANYQKLDPRLAKQFKQIETRLREFQAVPYER